jgi:prepilin-type processing-associated H-X9-DG protein
MELLVVLAIITILVAILAPALWVARNKAHSAVCINNLHQLGSAVNLYADDWDDTYPDAPGTAKSGSAPASIPNEGILTAQEIRDLYPAQGAYIWGTLTLTNKALSRSVFRCPNDNGAPDYDFTPGEPVWSHNVTSYMWDPDAALSANGEAAGEAVNGATLAEISDPAKARLLQDYGALWHLYLGKAVSPSGVRVQIGRVNVAFADGHVYWVNSSQVLAQNGSGGISPTLSSISSASPEPVPAPQNASASSPPTP